MPGKVTNTAPPQSSTLTTAHYAPSASACAHPQGKNPTQTQPMTKRHAHAVKHGAIYQGIKHPDQSRVSLRERCCPGTLLMQPAASGMARTQSGPGAILCMMHPKWLLPMPTQGLKTAPSNLAQLPFCSKGNNTQVTCTAGVCLTVASDTARKLLHTHVIGTMYGTVVYCTVCMRYSCCCQSSCTSRAVSTCMCASKCLPLLHHSRSSAVTR
jgi:hypothetical protein